MSWFRLVLLLLAFALCSVEAVLLWARAYPDVVALTASSARPAPRWDPLGAAGQVIADSEGGVVFMERMTHDDLARGVAALLEEPIDGEVPLTDSQVEGLIGFAQEGVALRARLEVDRGRAEVLRAAVLEANASAVVLLGPHRIQGMLGEGG